MSVDGLMVIANRSLLYSDVPLKHRPIRYFVGLSEIATFSGSLISFGYISGWLNDHLLLKCSMFCIHGNLKVIQRKCIRFLKVF